MKRDNEEQNVSIAETISAMQENLLTDSLSFAKIVQTASSVVEKTKIKFHKQKYKVGDVVYLSGALLNINWRMKEFIDIPFIVVATPLDTDKYKMYTVRAMGTGDECWHDVAVTEDFMYFRTEN